MSRENGNVCVEWEGRSLTLRLDLNAMCTLEEMFSLTVAEIIERVKGQSFTHMRGVLWAATRAHHPEMTTEEVGAMMLGDLGSALEDLTSSIAPHSADLAELKVQAKAARPINARPAKKKPRRAGGTGGVYTSMRAEPG